MMVDIEKLNVYHMVHLDRLPSIFESGFLYSDLTLQEMGIDVGTSIAYENIRQRRRQIPVVGVPDLVIGGCVPFYFGTHTPMLLRARDGKAAGYDYGGGQEAGHRDEKQAEFLVEAKVPLGDAFLGVGVKTEEMKCKVDALMTKHHIAKHAYVKAGWYFSEVSHG